LGNTGWLYLRPTFPDGAHYRPDGLQWPSAAFAASCGLQDELAKGCLYPAGIRRAFRRKTTFFVCSLGSITAQLTANLKPASSLP